jgi:hypothetical protein
MGKAPAASLDSRSHIITAALPSIAIRRPGYLNCCLVTNADYPGLMRWGFVTNADYPGLMRWGFVTNADYPGLSKYIAIDK